MHSRLQHQNHNCPAVAELLDHRWNHQRSIAHRITRDEEKCNLPGQRQPDESIEKSRMRDWRWVLAPNQIEHEVQRSDNQQAPNTGNPKYNLREFHRLIVLHFVMRLGLTEVRAARREGTRKILQILLQWLPAKRI